jgi:mannose-6-phosphate isomerase-like protein (cupin superfamily)
MKVLTGGCRVYEPGDGEVASAGPWTARTVMCRASGTTLITQMINDYAVGTSPSVVNPRAEEVLYVVEGTGICHLGGFAYPLEPGIGVFVPPGTDYHIENRGPGTLRLVSACCPEDSGRHVSETRTSPRPGEAPKRSVREEEREPIRAGKDRVFRYLVHTDVGCQSVTQFVGLIPKSRAPFHRHTYEEGIYILEGNGILHLRGQRHVTEFGAGSSIYFPVGVVHCLENPGPAPIRVLGVFHPSGSPGAAYEDD